MNAPTEPPRTVDDYIAGFPEETQAVLQQIRVLFRTALPGAREEIRYRIPAYVQDGNVIFFAGFSGHVSIYPRAEGDAALRKETAAFESGRGTYRFPLGQPLPCGLVGRIVDARAREHRAEVEAKLKTRKKARSPGKKSL